MVRFRIDFCSPYQSCSNTERTRRTLTVDFQSKHGFSIANGIIIRFDFEDVEGVRPVEFFFGGLTVLVEEDKVGREVKFVEYSASELLRVIDTIVLRSFWGDTVERGLRQDTKSSVCGIH